MFDFLRNLTKSADERQQESVAAYLDGALSDRARRQFEQAMAQDEALRQQVEQMLLIKQRLRQLPQRPVPRNFILDPAAYGRPAPQPWVTAYPVLRTATALAAFFFIFALVAGSFTRFGAGEQALLAPAADVAQQEEPVEVTRVVTESVDSLAAEPAAVEEAEMAVEAEAEEEMAEELIVEAETSEEAADEAAAEDEAMADEEPAPPAEPETTESLQGEMADDGDALAPQATALPAATTAPLPTATVSTLPRVTPPTPLPDRDPELTQESDDAADEVVADIPDPVIEAETEAAETTAVLPEESVQEVVVDEPVSPLLWLQIGLAGLLLLLGGLTFYARRQR